MKTPIFAPLRSGKNRAPFAPATAEGCKCLAARCSIGGPSYRPTIGSGVYLGRLQAIDHPERSEGSRGQHPSWSVSRRCFDFIRYAHFAQHDVWTGPTHHPLRHSLPQCRHSLQFMTTGVVNSWRQPIHALLAIHWGNPPKIILLVDRNRPRARAIMRMVEYCCPNGGSDVCQRHNDVLRNDVALGRCCAASRSCGRLPP